MAKSAFFIDLPNFYSHLLKAKIDKPQNIREYFLNWLDLDLLCRSLSNNISGIWVFYSGKRIGPSNERVSDNYLKDYINKVNRLEGITAKDVNIPGEQREAIQYKCKKCGNEVLGEYKSEKGIDASLTVHLFDTIDSWENAFLLSCDADFVPAVTSLRRRGKIIIGCGFENASSALMRECFNYIDIFKEYISQDYTLYKMFKVKGIAYKWVSNEIICHSEVTNNEPLTFSITLQSNPMGRMIESDDELKNQIKNYSIYLSANGYTFVDMTNRTSILDEFLKSYGAYLYFKQQSGGYYFEINLCNYPSVERKIRELTSHIKNIKIKETPRYNKFYLSCNFKYSQNEKKYLPVLEEQQ